MDISFFSGGGRLPKVVFDRLELVELNLSKEFETLLR